MQHKSILTIFNVLADLDNAKGTKTICKQLNNFCRCLNCCPISKCDHMSAHVSPYSSCYILSFSTVIKMV